MPKIMDITGQRYGLLTAVRRAHRHQKRWYWEFICSCGKIKIARLADVRCGHVQSCGCLGLSKLDHTTHGEARRGRMTPEYSVWRGMIKRCRNHPDYGARGITACERWQTYENFLADMGRRPSPSHSLDRIDVNGNYEPSNCRWVQSDVQALNRRRSSPIAKRLAEALAEIERLKTFSD